MPLPPDHAAVRPAGRRFGRRSLLAGFLLGGLSASLAAGCAPAAPRGPARIVFALSYAGRSGYQEAEFRRGMADLGYAEDRDFTLLRVATDGPERPADIAAEVDRLDPHVVVHGAGLRPDEMTRLARGPRPVLRPVNWPDATGHIASLARPGASVTGPALNVPDVYAKRLELLLELVPGLANVGYLDDASGLLPEAVRTSVWEATRACARQLGVRIDRFPAADRAGIAASADAAARSGAGGFLFVQGPLFTAAREEALRAVERHGGRAVHTDREFAEEGGLAAYGIDARATFRRMAAYVDRILRGASPAELPVELPTRFDLVLHAGTAARIGVVLPEAVLAQATEVLG